MGKRKDPRTFREILSSLDDDLGDALERLGLELNDKLGDVPGDVSFASVTLEGGGRLALVYFPSAGAVESLTQRELEVARLVGHCLGNDGIAASLGIQERTVANHLQNIYRKLGIRRRAALTRFAMLALR